MGIRSARAALADDLMSREPGVVAVGLSERGGARALTVLLDGPAQEIPSQFRGFPVFVIQSGAFYGAPDSTEREVA